jgi:UDP-2,3-diacylglucosamine pyrophosphatase LpxH
VFIRYSPFIARLGGKGYDLLILINRWVNKVRLSLGMSRMSFAQKVKYQVKEAVKFVSDFEETAIQLAAEDDYDYVICGHIHRPTIRKVNVGDKEVNYLNSGDWVESLSALEYKWGKWSLYEYDESEFELTNPKLQVPDAAEDEDEVMAEQQITEIMAQITGQGIKVSEKR